MTAKRIENSLEELAAESIEKIRTFLNKAEPTSLDVGVARVASSALAAYTRSQQTQGAREATAVMLARELAEDGASLRRYLKVAIPSSSLARAIEDAEKKAKALT